jgi:hypothetical protein
MAVSFELRDKRTLLGNVPFAFGDMALSLSRCSSITQFMPQLKMGHDLGVSVFRVRCETLVRDPLKLGLFHGNADLRGHGKALICAPQIFFALVNLPPLKAQPGRSYLVSPPTDTGESRRRDRLPRCLCI